MISERFFVACSAILLGIFTLLSVGSAHRESLTYDEIVHIEEGKNALVKHEFVVDTNNPPLIRELAVIPLILGADQAFFARLVVVAMGVVLGIAILMVAAHYFGREAGLFALFLYVFEPNILAHSHYVTMDLGAALFFFLAYMSLLWLLKKPTWAIFVIHGILVGLMASSKLTALLFYFVSDVIVCFFLSKGRQLAWLWKYKWHMIVTVALCLLTIWSTYFFRTNVVIVPGTAAGRVSSMVRAFAKTAQSGILLQSLDFLEKQPVPLGDYIAVIKNTAVRATRPQDVFFLGTFYPKSRWYFMLVHVFLKTHVVLWVLFFVSIWMAWRTKDRAKKIMPLAIPVVSILVVAALSGMQPQVRYVLPMYPFLLLTAASMYTFFRHPYQKIVLLVACVLYAAATLSFYPHFISYANVLAGPKERLYGKFIDSNIDWGQSLPDLQMYVKKVKPSSIQFSYFGRDDAGKYGLPSDFAFGSYKFNEICAFHDIEYPENSGPSFTVMSISNWRYCGYSLDPRFSAGNIDSVVGLSLLVFPSR